MIMGNKKNIDKLFQEQFKGFNQTPNHKVWDTIKQDLETSKSNKKTVPFWMFFSGIAATITLLIVIGITQFPSIKTTPIIVEEPSEKPPISVKNKNILKENTLENTVVNTPFLKKNNTPISSRRTINLQHKSIVTATSKSNSEKNNGASLQNKNTAITSNSFQITNTTPKNSSFTDNNTTHKQFQKQNKHSKSDNNYVQNKVITIAVKNNPQLIVHNSDLKKPEKEVQNSLDNTIVTSEKNNATAQHSNATEDPSEQKNNEKKKEDIATAIAAQELKKETKEEDEEKLIVAQNKWSIIPSIAPVYYNTFSKGSPIDTQFANNTKKGQINASYGITVSYALNKKFSIRTGVHALNLGYDTQDVAVLPISSTVGAGVGVNLKGVNALSGIDLNITNANSFSVSQIPKRYSALFNSSLNQRLGYIEVPLEIGYQISNKKININILAGMSTFVLNKNEIYSETNGIESYLGSGNNLNKISFSTNIGVGFKYSISKYLRFNLEPTLKYQVNAFTKDAGNFKPYILGVYSGFSFQF